MSARCFFALLPDAATRDALTALRPARPPGTPPAPDDGLHLTLRFHPALPQRTLEDAARILPTLAASLPPLAPVALTGWATGPHTWVQVVEYAPHAGLLRLHAVLARWMPDPAAGTIPWQPHVTLARGRGTARVRPVPAAALPVFTAATLALIVSRAHGGRYCHITRAEVPVQQRARRRFTAALRRHVTHGTVSGSQSDLASAACPGPAGVQPTIPRSRHP